MPATLGTGLLRPPLPNGVRPFYGHRNARSVHFTAEKVSINGQNGSFNWLAAICLLKFFLLAALQMVRDYLKLKPGPQNQTNPNGPNLNFITL